MRSILSIVAGVAVGVLAVFFLEMINLSLYPVPSDLNIESKVEMNAYIKSLPYSAFVMIVIAHVVGAFLAAFIAGMVARSKRIRIGLIAGAFLLVFTILNAFSVGQPNLISAIDILLTAAAGLLGARVGASRSVS